ncbi:MAG TPA: hypothetical protein HPP76_06795 [Desulfuromonadales bacterium]|nr:hypothetical protein [Desulfuromonadales bacterium]
MEEMIKKLYAEELKLIATKPIQLKQKGQFFSVIKEKCWTRQSAAVKVGIVAFFLMFATAMVYYYNLFTIESYKVRLEAAQIEAELQRRDDLIPSLVKAVTDYMAFEGNVFQHAADVRSALNNIKDIPRDAAIPAASVQAALSKFQAVAENYPLLKSSETYQNLMKELSNTETRIAAARIKYNLQANYYNSRLKLLPGVFFGHLLFFEPVRTFASEKGSKAIHGGQ